MKHEDRLAFIAEGLPILLASAQGFQDAAARLHDSPREEDVMVSFSEEEAAKILILIDIGSLPPRPSKPAYREADALVLRSLGPAHLRKGHELETYERWPAPALCRN